MAVEMVDAVTSEAVVVVAAAAAEGTTLNSSNSRALTSEIQTLSHRLLKSEKLSATNPQGKKKKRKNMHLSSSVRPSIHPSRRPPRQSPSSS